MILLYLYTILQIIVLFLLWAKKSNFSEQTLIAKLKTALSTSLFGNFQASTVSEVSFS